MDPRPKLRTCSCAGPYFYFVFLTVLLTHRAFRDGERCAAKYGAAWDEYRAKVPHRIPPSWGGRRR